MDKAEERESAEGRFYVTVNNPIWQLQDVTTFLHATKCILHWQSFAVWTRWLFAAGFVFYYSDISTA